MIPWNEALAAMLARMEPLPGERRPLDSVLGRVLREDACADADYPAFDLATMDGYALRAAVAPGAVVSVTGETRAGDPPTHFLGEGEGRRIFTGAPLPTGATVVIPQEDVEPLGDGKIRVLRQNSAAFVRPRASEACRGETILRTGQKLGPTEMAILATLGMSRPLVNRPIHVVHLVLGDELLDPSEEPRPGAIRDSNSTLVAALLEAEGAIRTQHRRLPDDPGIIASALDGMPQETDMVLLSGGASVGRHDHARACLESAGFKWVFDRLSLRPGRPTGGAFRGRQVAFCLAGNPVAHLVAFHLMVRPVLRALADCRDPMPCLAEGILAAALPNERNGRHTFWPAVMSWEEKGPALRPLRFSSSGDLLGVVGINALLSLPPNQTPPAAGSRVAFLPLH